MKHTVKIDGVLLFEFVLGNDENIDFDFAAYQNGEMVAAMLDNGGFSCLRNELEMPEAPRL